MVALPCWQGSAAEPYKEQSALPEQAVHVSYMQAMHFKGGVRAFCSNSLTLVAPVHPEIPAPRAHSHGGYGRCAILCDQDETSSENQVHAQRQPQRATRFCPDDAYKA